MRVAIAGLGNVAERIHIPACREVEGIEIVGASEPREDRREAMRQKFGLSSVYATTEEMLDRTAADLLIIGP